MTLAYISCSSGKFINLAFRHGFHTRSSALSTGGFLYAVSSGSVPDRHPLSDPHLAGVCCRISCSCRLLPAPRGAYLPECFSGSQVLLEGILTQLLTSWKMTQGTCHCCCQMLLFLSKSHQPRQLVRVVKIWTLESVRILLSQCDFYHVCLLS